MNSALLRPALGSMRWCGVTACGLGHMRPASGTWGSLPPVVLAGVLAFIGVSQPVWIITMVIVAAAASWMCVRWGTAAEQAIGRKDPSEVVIDEVAGQAVALAMVWDAALAPGGVGAFEHSIVVGGTAFVLFRIFDIVKPWPIGGLQRFHGGTGIVLDDLAAGFAAGLTQLLLRYLFSFC
ncbi:MAG: phosphatidylglycerophosphatase A [Planctomycetes bacterium]|nr:phosphatidylglycerophosphatase A [Planctomycetota bacterium]